MPFVQKQQDTSASIEWVQAKNNKTATVRKGEVVGENDKCLFDHNFHTFLLGGRCEGGDSVASAEGAEFGQREGSNIKRHTQPYIPGTRAETMKINCVRNSVATASST